MEIALTQAIEEAISVQAGKLQIKQLVTGKVIRIDDTTCDLERQGAPTLYGVRLNAIVDTLDSYVTLYPPVGSYVIAGIIENLKTEAVLLRCSEVEKVNLKIGKNKMQVDAAGVNFENTDADTEKLNLKFGSNEIYVNNQELSINNQAAGGSVGFKVGNSEIEIADEKFEMANLNESLKALLSDIVTEIMAIIVVQGTGPNLVNLGKIVTRINTFFK